jgi:hypothetical protein
VEQFLNCQFVLKSASQVTFKSIAFHSADGDLIPVVAIYFFRRVLDIKGGLFAVTFF